MGILHWILTGEWKPIPPDHTICQQTRRVVPPGYHYCEMCDKHIKDGVRCDYDWGGNCSAAKFSWVRDGGPPVRSGKGALDRIEQQLKERLKDHQ